MSTLLYDKPSAVLVQQHQAVFVLELAVLDRSRNAVIQDDAAIRASSTFSTGSAFSNSGTASIIVDCKISSSFNCDVIDVILR